MGFWFRIRDLFLPAEKDPYSNVKVDKQREFYLDEGKSYQYIPKTRLNFEKSYLTLYKYRGVSFKVLYLPKVPIPALVTTGLATGGAFGSSMPLIVVSIIVPFALALIHSVLFCRIAKEIHLHEDGDKIDVVYSIMNLVEKRKTHLIKDFSDQRQRVPMLMWSLNPIPKNILAGIECDLGDLMPMHANKNYGFYLLHGKPQIFHQDLLVNCLNGVIIDTKSFQPRVNYFKERYRVLKNSSS